MTVWEKVEEEDYYVVAIYNYTGSSASGVPHLGLSVGELVRVRRRARGWLWGERLRGAGRGAFPASHVRRAQVCREDGADDDDPALVSAGGGGVIHELAVTLREWLPLWKQLYKSNDHRFKFMEVSMRALLELRASCARDALPADQLRRRTALAAATVDKGHRTLGLPVAVRDSACARADPRLLSASQLLALHESPGAVDSGMEPAAAAMARARGCSVLVRVHNFVCRAAPRVELLLSLHTASRALTEPAVVNWPPAARAADLLVYTDLPSDIKKEKIFLVCHVIRVGPMESQNVENRRSSVSSPPPPRATDVRRGCGAALCDVSKPLADPALSGAHILLPFTPLEKENLDSLVKKLISNREPKDAKQTQGLWVSLQLLDGDLLQIREQNPHLIVGTTAVARSLSLPEVILPGDARNDLYVTLGGGAYSCQGAAHRNIQLQAALVTVTGQIHPGAISVGCGVPPVDQYTSLVYYHDDKPRWNETFKVCIGIEEFKESHLVIFARHRSSNEAKDRSEKPFAVSYMRLMQRDGTTVPDDTHQLNVYKIEYKRMSGDGAAAAAAACLGLPERRADLPPGCERGLTRGPLALVYRDTLTVATALTSTKLTQREEILGVLKWKTRLAEGTLAEALQRLTQVPGEEVVKLLEDILDALTQILTQVDEPISTLTEGSTTVLALDCLLRVASLVLEHKYLPFQPVLRAYVQGPFCNAMLYEKLLPLLTWSVVSAEANGERGAKRLLLAMKGLELCARLAVRSRQLCAALRPHAHSAHETQLQEFMASLEWLMTLGPHALTCQGSCLKYLPHAAPHLCRLVQPQQLCILVVRCFSALPLPRLGKQRMQSLLELLRGELSRGAARAVLLPHVAETAAAMLADDLEVELCIEALGEIMSLVSRGGTSCDSDGLSTDAGAAGGHSTEPGGAEEERAELCAIVLPTVLRVASSMMRDHCAASGEPGNADPLLRRTICVLIDCVRELTPAASARVAAKLRQRDSAGGVVSGALSLLRALLPRPVFPHTHAAVLHLQLAAALHALRLMTTTLRERLDSSDPSTLPSVHRLWREWFLATAELGTAAPLQLEAAAAAWRARVRALHGDVREEAAALMSDMWHHLGPHKPAFIPCVVGPFLEVSLTRCAAARDRTLPLFCDMCQVLYDNRKEDETEESCLRVLETALVDKLDTLVSAGCGSGEWRAEFVRVCGGGAARCRPALRPHAAALVAAAAQQMDLLLEYRDTDPAQTHHRMYLTVRILHFYQQIQRTELYIRYIHKLADAHRTASHWTEAACALRLHCTLLSWEPPMRQLKESLYGEVISLLQSGRQWESAVEAVKELVTLYEQDAGGYAALAELHTQLSCLYSSMLRTPRSHAGYFRVVHHGRAAPTPQSFVYRGQEFEQLADFKERLLNEWPRARVLNKLDPPGEDITQADEHFIQINSVEPVLSEEKLKRLSGRPVAEQILQFLKHNNVDTFSFSRPFYRPESGGEEEGAHTEFATRWLERTVIKTSDQFPGILRCFPVVSERTHWVSPLEAAVEALTESNRALRALVTDTRASHAPLSTLTMRLTGILDPAVQGGIANYEKAFLSAPPSEDPAVEALRARLRELVVDQLPILNEGLQVHASRLTPDLEALQQHLLSCYHRLRAHVRARYPPHDVESVVSAECEVSLRRPGGGAGGAARASDVASEATDSSSKSKFFSFNSFNGTPFNPLARYSGAGAGYFSTLQSSPKRRNKRHGRKSEISSASPNAASSQWYTSTGPGTPPAPAAPAAPAPAPASVRSSVHSVSSVTSAGEGSPLRELRQELVPARPTRREAERRASARADSLLLSPDHSNRDSIGTTDSNQEEEEPPPLPAKSREPGDTNNNNNNQETRYNYDLVTVVGPTGLAPRGSFLYTSLASRRTPPAPPAPAPAPPTPPPKKHHRHHPDYNQLNNNH
ncbi:dedicator of cytokinesis protein 1-like isoform X4 [Plutella xylostella]|uniref:dedicator of cytokinesis protein 1-like isoform X3 n=1 Tax=Plutella xylostella TaxID=51655 RepID=UPI002032F13D|nr:dedicator of cytokinesis protein 1-like isoform X3 [Plutella xylostella]XP_048486656.1 dedicator of cytokinesis protein 1-like isoform X4 [Plutella xylostella]